MTAPPRRQAWRHTIAAVLGLLLTANFASLQLINCTTDNVQEGKAMEGTTTTTLPPVHIGSTWIGNHWIPPKGYRLYSPEEMREYFSQYKILFLGDSTGRRAYATLYGIMNSTDLSNVRVPQVAHPSVIDVNKRIRVENCTKPNRTLCRHMPPSNNNGTRRNPIDLHQYLL